jgi:hypothetical protein
MILRWRLTQHGPGRVKMGWKARPIPAEKIKQVKACFILAKA